MGRSGEWGKRKINKNKQQKQKSQVSYKDKPLKQVVELSTISDFTWRSAGWCGKVGSRKKLHKRSEGQTGQRRNGIWFNTLKMLGKVAVNSDEWQIFYFLKKKIIFCNAQIIFCNGGNRTICSKVSCTFVFQMLNMFPPLGTHISCRERTALIQIASGVLFLFNHRNSNW